MNNCNHSLIYYNTYQFIDTQCILNWFIYIIYDKM